MFTVLLTPAEADDEKEGDISNGSTTIGVTPTPLKESLLTTPSKVCDPFVPEKFIDALSELAELAVKMVRKAASLGKVVIVTNAQVRLSIKALKVRRDGKLMHSEISLMVNDALVTKELTESTSMDSINEVYIGPARFDSRVLAQCDFDWGFPTRKGSIDESNFGKYSDSEDGEQLIDSQRALMSTRMTVIVMDDDEGCIAPLSSEIFRLPALVVRRIKDTPRSSRCCTTTRRLEILVGSVNGRKESSNSNS
ncbi:hypothetical protein Pmar_PMAR009255 [Perkinsus marinus ATCC 50983]|uniref:Uncharacterized protein n=1 Tax=Perkinsus marinus (strain ATCC 50983 / TXsc) TaxID=423536 RepID=C5M0E9_PERM5|nr:hypothetical protein Pmar_PMAR009255 [Perkinsus marinus ATCC 50983]EEQ97556.1 hypothetical protein Pmar_PMAR009255 [Perkinsus marinus ATCC 50983]|eukprot:XP_002764839.1 hypothetical protein Pmar_PMAR009255 [Perkinsus marinus ATCC 50983]